jgi:hypothetical protein
MLHYSKRPDQKMFLVLLPRRATLNRKSQHVYPVQVAEIGKVLPRVYQQTFNSNNESIRLQSKASVNMHTKKHWFALPRMPVVQLQEIAEKVFINRFSQEAFDTFTELYFPSETKPEDCTEDSKHQASATSDGDQSTSSPVHLLPNREIVPDDWEDLLS